MGVLEQDIKHIFRILLSFASVSSNCEEVFLSEVGLVYFASMFATSKRHVALYVLAKGFQRPSLSIVGVSSSYPLA